MLDWAPPQRPQVLSFGGDTEECGSRSRCHSATARCRTPAGVIKSNSRWAEASQQHTGRDGSIVMDGGDRLQVDANVARCNPFPCKIQLTEPCAICLIKCRTRALGGITLLQSPPFAASLRFQRQRRGRATAPVIALARQQLGDSDRPPASVMLHLLHGSK